MGPSIVKRGRYRETFDLSGKVAVVTGGAGILGQHFCSGLADFGAQVAVVDVDEGKASELAGELTKIFAVRCLGVGCDVVESESISAMLARVELELGPVDILHNNAATKGSSLNSFFAPVEQFAADTWREVMAVNLDGMFKVAQLVGGRMAARGKGSIIQTASIYGIVGPDQRIYEGSSYLGSAINTPAVYSASKAGVIGLTRHLATYWANRGVRVNALTPGGVASGQNTVFNERYSNRVPMGRMARAEEMVPALVYLASDASSYVTGQNIVVDGGLSTW
jgi:NAD(P)-dependent dehydrogenase (short-subunit alcohol dehydrogenase family)